MVRGRRGGGGRGRVGRGAPDAAGGPGRPGRGRGGERRVVGDPRAGRGREGGDGVVRDVVGMVAGAGRGRGVGGRPVGRVARWEWRRLWGRVAVEAALDARQDAAGLRLAALVPGVEGLAPPPSAAGGGRERLHRGRRRRRRPPHGLARRGPVPGRVEQHVERRWRLRARDVVVGRRGRRGEEREVVQAGRHAAVRHRGGGQAGRDSKVPDSSTPEMKVGEPWIYSRAPGVLEKRTTTRVAPRDSSGRWNRSVHPRPAVQRPFRVLSTDETVPGAGSKQY